MRANPRSLRQNRQVRLKKKHVTLPCLVALLQKRAQGKDHRHLKDKAWELAKVQVQSHMLREPAKKSREEV